MSLRRTDRKVTGTPAERLASKISDFTSNGAGSGEQGIHPSSRDGRPTPIQYTGDGADVSPPLQWSGAPPGTKSFALICDDPDAPRGTWVHWVLYVLPASTRNLPERLPTNDTLPNGVKQGLTDFKRTGYGGPCPPTGNPHRYFFKLYALDTELELEPRATKQQLLKAMQGHILAEASLMGEYQRER